MAVPFSDMQRDDAIAAMESAPPWASYQIRDPQVITLTPESGIALCSVTAQKGRTRPLHSNHQ